LLTVISCIVVIAVIGFIFSVKPKNLPAPEPVSPLAAVDERKAAIYENLRDLQFEYRVGKLSDEDYQSTKKDLQKELAAVLAEADRIKGLPAAAPAAPVSRTIPELVTAPAPQPAAAPSIQEVVAQDTNYFAKDGGGEAAGQ